MNDLPQDLATGTLGELLVQTRLLQYDVQAAQPLKDTGNDLIAVRGQVIKTIQVKTTRGDRPPIKRPDREYDLQALVILVGEDRELYLDRCELFLIPVEEINEEIRENIDKYRLSMQLIENLFPK